MKGTVDEQVNAGTLASKDVTATAFDETVNERTLVSSIVARYSLLNVTKASGVGPLMVGVAHGDYSAPEIEEWIENTGSWNEGDLVNQEIAGRKIRKIGIFDQPATISESSVLNDGKAIKTKLNWILLQGQGLQYFLYNLGSSAFSTTDPAMNAQGHANLWPK